MKTTETLLFRKVLQWTSLGTILTLLLIYTVFQARFLIIGPQIVLSDSLQVRQNERGIFLEGTAFNISRLWLNDRKIYTNAQGEFRELLVLEDGVTISTLRAEDRYGRDTVVKSTFVYSPSSLWNEDIYPAPHPTAADL